jgi:tRNA dimethylallyltransferase
MSLPSVEPDNEFREFWEKYALENGTGSVHKILEDKDPVTASKIHVNHTRRIIRALEVLEKTGKPLSYWHKLDSGEGSALLPNCIFVGLSCERQLLIQRVEKRVDQMIEQGFFEEVRSLIQRGYKENLKSMQSLGYKELCAANSGECSIDKSIELIKIHTRQYARRQMIWFRAEKRITWLNIESRSLEDIAFEILRMYNSLSSLH